MKFKKYVPYLIIALFATVACKKKETPIPTNVPVDIYTVGYVVMPTTRTINMIATYWKNGVPTELSDTTFASDANAIAIGGKDVYIVGDRSDGNGNHAVMCWKNGNPTVLQNGSGATAIAVNGADVYVAGAIG